MKKALLLAVVASGCSAPSPDAMEGTGAPDHVLVWRDIEGRVIAQAAPGGGLVLIWRDEIGRIISVELRKGEFDLGSGPVPSGGDLCWKHCFVYDESGFLKKEYDCRGVLHALAAGTTSKIDPARGTAVPGHQHAEDR